MNGQTDRAKEIFLDALNLDSPDQRRVFLDRECGGNGELRAEVEDLLAHHLQLGSFLASVSRDPSPTASLDLPSIDGPGTMIGPYRLMEQIGEGGFGLVFVAEQQQPVRRRVALKVIKPGMDSGAVVARFEAERQALALMDHPNIAKVFDGGATESGRPFFVMELVKGVPITQFCDDNRLTPRERLQLFVDLCSAVQHAHQKGVIHRDLKPANVLVTSHDGKPVVKVIDFGVAKAIGESLTEKTVYTAFAQMVGTPLYMSPEQAGSSGLDVDTRTDIYALGVLLYELLTGTTPFDKERLRKAGYDEIRRIIREEEPPKPSTRISTLGPVAATVSANRGSEPRKLSALIRGELDWIVMKALEKDRNRRYESASSLAADVQRYLKDEPVQACPPSTRYRLRKFVRRNRVGVAAAAAATLVVLIAVAGLAVGYVLVAREKDRTAAALEQARDNEKAFRAQLQRADENLRLAIDKGGATVVNWGFFWFYPDQTYHQYLLPEEANALRQSLQVYRAFMDVNSGDQSAGLDVTRTRERVALLHLAFGEYRAAEEAIRTVVVLREELTRSNPTVIEHHWYLIDGHLNLAETLEKLGQFGEAERLYQRSLRVLPAEFMDRWNQSTAEARGVVTQGDIYHQLAWGYAFLGRLLHRTGRPAEAEAAFRQALVFADRQGPDIANPFPTGATRLHSTATDGLGRVFLATGRLKEAEDACRWVCRMWDELLAASPGNRHYLWNAAAASEQLGEFYQATGRGKEAAVEYRKALKIWEDLTAQYPTVPAYPRQLAWFLAFGPIPELRDPARAATLAGKAAELAPNDGHNWTTLAAARYRTENWTEAQAALEKAMTLRPWGEGLDWFLTAMIRWRVGDKPGARQWYDKAVEWMARNDAYNTELRRLQGEAAELLELTKK